MAPPWSTLPWHRAGADGARPSSAAGRRSRPRRRAVAASPGSISSAPRSSAASLPRSWLSSSATAIARKPCSAQVSRGGGAQALGGALGLPQGARPFPGDQRALQAQRAGRRTASRWRRSATSPIRWASAPTTPTPSRGAASSPSTEWNGDRLVLSGDIEVVDKFQRSYRLVRMPLKSVPARCTAAGRRPERCRYLVTRCRSASCSRWAAPRARGRSKLQIRSR